MAPQENDRVVYLTQMLQSGPPTSAPVTTPERSLNILKVLGVEEEEEEEEGSWNLSLNDTYCDRWREAVAASVSLVLTKPHYAGTYPK